MKYISLFMLFCTLLMFTTPIGHVYAEQENTSLIPDKAEFFSKKAIDYMTKHIERIEKVLPLISNADLIEKLENYKTTLEQEIELMQNSPTRAEIRQSLHRVKESRNLLKEHHSELRKAHYQDKLDKTAEKLLDIASRLQGQEDENKQEIGSILEQEVQRIQESLENIDITTATKEELEEIKNQLHAAKETALDQIREVKGNDNE